MYNKFRFYEQPIFATRPDVCHPDFEVEFTGVVEEDIDGGLSVVELFINGNDVALYGDKTKTGDYARFRTWLNDRVTRCDLSPEKQAQIELPAASYYSKYFVEKSGRIASRIEAVRGEVAPGETLEVTAEAVRVSGSQHPSNAREVAFDLTTFNILGV